MDWDFDGDLFMQRPAGLEPESVFGSIDAHDIVYDSLQKIKQELEGKEKEVKRREHTVASRESSLKRRSDALEVREKGFQVKKKKTDELAVEIVKKEEALKIMEGKLEEIKKAIEEFEQKPPKLACCICFNDIGEDKNGKKLHGAALRCGHNTFCYPCVSSKLLKECPICRKKKGRPIKLF